jgi:hypothetical protein
LCSCSTAPASHPPPLFRLQNAAAESIFCYTKEASLPCVNHPYHHLITHY